MKTSKMVALLSAVLLCVLLSGCAVKQAVEYATVNDVEIGYLVKGQGEPLLMVMAFSGTMDVWDQVLIEELARDYKVIMFDNRNVGFSSTSETEVTIPLMAEDALGLMDALGIESAHVLGWSMGSVIAQEMALQRPEKVRKLVLYGSVLDTNVLQDAVRKFDGLTREQFLAMLFPKQWLEQHPDIYSQLPSPRRRATPEAIKRQRQASLIWGGAANRLPELDKPVLVIAGEDDNIIPAGQSNKLAAAIDGAWLVQFKGAGHWLMYQTPGTMAATIRLFLENEQDLLN